MNLGGCDLEDKDLVKISEKLDLKSITNLKLAKNKFTSIQPILQMLSDTHLKELDLSSIPIDYS